MSSVTENTIVAHAGYKFGFSRDLDGNGYWYSLNKGRNQFAFGYGAVVPVGFWGEIFSSAINQGIDVSVLRYSPPEKTTDNDGATKIFAGDKAKRSVKPAKSNHSIKIF